MVVVVVVVVATGAAVVVDGAAVVVVVVAEAAPADVSAGASTTVVAGDTEAGYRMGRTEGSATRAAMITTTPMTPRVITAFRIRRTTGDSLASLRPGSVASRRGIGHVVPRGVDDYRRPTFRDQHFVNPIRGNWLTCGHEHSPRCRHRRVRHPVVRRRDVRPFPLRPGHRPGRRRPLRT